MFSEKRAVISLKMAVKLSLEELREWVISNTVHVGNEQPIKT